MSRTHYKIYQEQTFVLAKTLIIKHEEVARSMNEELYNRQYVVDSNPYNWRYYLNLNGEYHEADKDELYDQYGTEYMLVKLPSDNGPIEVELTKELLHGNDADKALTNEYQIGSKFYTELVSRYPDFETLIIGILNPIEKEVSLSAKNGEILFVAGRYKKIEGDRSWFDTDGYSVNEVLIEPQEDNLIFELQKYIYNFLRHWNNPDYVIGNDLYTVTMLGILYSNITVAILNIRLGNCKTVKAHTFHIREYLESHGQIGRYVDFIPIASALWLYRNTMYLEANSGKQLTFDSLMDNILTPNEIPMSAYSIRHELSNMNDDKLIPTGMLYKEILNFEVVGASDDDRTVRDILDDQVGLARDNHLDLEYKTDKIQDIIDWGGDDRINSKVLESEMLELGEPYPFTLNQFLFNMWGYTALRDYYTGTVYATNPLTGERISFNAKNAYIMAQYCMNKAVAGITLEKIPTPTIYNIPKTIQPDNLPNSPAFAIKPSIDECMNWCVANKTRRLKVLEVNGTFVPNFYANDSNDFFNNVTDIYHERVRKYNTYCDVEDVEERGDLELVAKRLYWTGFKQQSVDMLYDDWFRTVGFDPDSFSDNDLLNIGLELVASATGTVDKETISKRWLQKSLLSIMRHFISYSVHIIEKFAEGVVSYLEGQTLRYSNFKWEYIGGLPVKYSIANDYSLKTYVKQYVHLDVSNIFEETVVDVSSKSKVSYDVTPFGVDQKSHKLHVGIYALNADIINIEFNVEEAELLQLNIIDPHVNTITTNPLSGSILDVTSTYTFMSPTLSVDIGNVYASSVDQYMSLFGIDTNQTGVTVDGMSANITDNNSDTRIPDQSVVQLSGIQGVVNDSINEPLTFVDSNVVFTRSISADTRNRVDNSGFDVESLGLSNISASQLDNALHITHVDNSVLSVVDTQVSLVDPQIPEVIIPFDISVNKIVNISGSSVDVITSNLGMSTNILIVDNVLVNVSEDFVTVDNMLDTSTVTIGSVTMDSHTVTETLKVSDLGDTAIIDNVTATLSDNTIESANNDLDAVDLINITLNVVDVSKSLIYDTHGVTVNTITAGVVDNEIQSKGLDNNAFDIQNITASIADPISQVTGVDIDSVVTNNVVMHYNDTSDNVVVATECDIISMTSIKIEVNEDVISPNLPDVSALTIRDITISSNNVVDIIAIKSSDNVNIPIHLISMNLNDIEVGINFTEDNKDGLIINQVNSVMVTPILNIGSNDERHYLDITDSIIRGEVIDTIDELNLKDNNQSNSVNVTSTSGNILDTEYLLLHDDIDSVSIYGAININIIDEP